MLNALWDKQPLVYASIICMMRLRYRQKVNHIYVQKRDIMHICMCYIYHQSGGDGDGDDELTCNTRTCTLIGTTNGLPKHVLNSLPFNFHKMISRRSVYHLYMHTHMHISSKPMRGKYSSAQLGRWELS